MSFPNVSDIVATTIEARTRKIRDNVTNNNALLKRLEQKGNIRTFSGGRLIYEELSFQENGNFGWYSGYDQLPVGAADVITAAEFSIKQCATPVIVSGLEELQNAGREQMIDLIEGRVRVAEDTMANNISIGLYSDGTGSNSKTITGLDAAVTVDPTTGTYGGINRVNWPFWRSQVMTGTAYTSANVQAGMNTMWAKLVRGNDRPDLIIADSTMWGIYMASLQTLQRFVDVKKADLGFAQVQFMDADVVLDGGIGGAATASTLYFLNTKFLHYRPHKDRNIKALNPERRFPINQDSNVQIIAWAGNLTCSGAKFQGRIRNS